jgi:tRNA(Ile)-lysidine synthase
MRPEYLLSKSIDRFICARPLLFIELPATGKPGGSALSRYHPFVPRTSKSKSGRGAIPGLPLDTSLLKPGMRLAVALSGGVDSVALLRALAERRQELGLVLHAAHLHHGLRGAEADGDLEFCRELAAKLEIPFHEAHVETAAAAHALERDLCGIESHPSRKNKNAARVGHPVFLGRGNRAAAGKGHESIEEAARRLRYCWFGQLLREGLLDAIATAHTLDDQAETVLAKFLRGAWTEGLAGINPKLEGPEGGGAILRPLLETKRSEIEAYLRELDQEWREDSSNRNLSFTRNRIRHELLPLLEGWNPRLREHLAQMAELAHDEEAWWQAELARLGSTLILPGRPARGGGRAAGAGADAGVAIEVSRLAALAPAVQRRLVRHAAQQFGAALDFAATEAVRSLAIDARAGQRLALPQGLCAERTARELRLSVAAEPAAKGKAQGPQYTVVIPGVIDAPEFGVRIRIAPTDKEVTENERVGREGLPRTATLRNWKPGDRVRLRHSSGLRKVKEVLERKHVTGTERALWPVLEAGGRVVWMKGVELEREPGLEITAVEVAEDASQAAPRALSR